MIDRETISWAKKALDTGEFSAAYIAEALECKEREINDVIARGAPSRARAQAEALFSHAVPEEIDPPRPRLKLRTPIDESALRSRRKFLLGARFSRNWDGIWFAFKRGTTGRTIRKTYGSENLIWAVGGGIDAELPE